MAIKLRTWCGLCIGKWSVTLIVRPFRWQYGLSSAGILDGGLLQEAYLGPLTVMIGK